MWIPLLQILHRPGFLQGILEGSWRAGLELPGNEHKKHQLGTSGGSYVTMGDCSFELDTEASGSNVEFTMQFAHTFLQRR